VDNFVLYDFFTSDGSVNEDVFVHSNQHNGERGLVIYHNKYAETSGWVKTSVSFMDKASGQMLQKTLAEGLALPREGFAIFRDYVSHLEYIRPCAELWEKGLFASLSGYACHAFLDWRFVSGENWRLLAESLNGAGIDSIQAHYDEKFTPQPAAVETPPPAAKKPRAKKKSSAVTEKTSTRKPKKVKPTSAEPATRD